MIIAENINNKSGEKKLWNKNRLEFSENPFRCQRFFLFLSYVSRDFCVSSIHYYVFVSRYSDFQFVRQPIANLKPYGSNSVCLWHSLGVLPRQFWKMVVGQRKLYRHERRAKIMTLIDNTPYTILRCCCSSSLIIHIGKTVNNDEIIID